MNPDGTPTITLYSICKDEEKHVERWLRQALAADHALALDTGSSDSTFALLREMAGEFPDGKLESYSTHEWDDGSFRFDEARDRALSMAKEAFPDTDVFVSVDFDEEFSQGWAEVLKREWDPARHTRASYPYYYRDWDLENSRNWIHGPQWSWLYPVHECLTREGGVFYTADECLDLHGTDFELRHWKDTSKSRSSYLPLIRKRYEENPEDGYSLCYLLRELMYYREWDEILSMDGTYVGSDIDRHGQLCYYGRAHQMKGRVISAYVKYQAAIDLVPNLRAPYIWTIELLMQKDSEDPVEAERVYDAMMAAAPEHTPDWDWADEDEMWTWAPGYWASRIEEMMEVA